MKKLAIYYGWPSAVHNLEKESGSLEQTIDIFSDFDLFILADGLENPVHDDHENTKKIISGSKSNGKEFFGYINTGNCPEYPILTEMEIYEKLEKWLSTGFDGVLYDLLDPPYKASPKRIANIVNHAHDMGLKAFYNITFDSVSEGWLEERVNPIAKNDDMLLIEPFGTSWEKEKYPLPKRLPKILRNMQKKNIQIAGVSTYDPEKISVLSDSGKEILSKRHKKYKHKAEQLGLDCFQFTNGLYSSSGKEANLLIDFDSL